MSEKTTVFNAPQAESKKNVFAALQSYICYGFSKTLAKHSILPATIFNKMQIDRISNAFDKFWGLDSEEPCFKQHEQYSTFTLTDPKSLWTHYFKTIEEVRSIRSTYRFYQKNILTTDYIELCAGYFKHKNHEDTNARVLIIFGGNGELYKIGAQAWLFKLLSTAKTPFSILMFDPRECGNSKGKANAVGLVKDGEAIYNYAKNHLGYSEDQIDLCGFSLGAAIATLVKASHPHTKGCLISNRSFYSLGAAIKGMFTKLAKPFSKPIYKLARKIAGDAKWELNPFEAWKTITSRKMVIAHSKDPVVHYSASLDNALEKENLLNDCHRVHLKQKNPDQPIKNHHVWPLSYYNDSDGQDAEERVLNFLEDY